MVYQLTVTCGPTLSNTRKPPLAPQNGAAGTRSSERGPRLFCSLQGACFKLSARDPKTLDSYHTGACEQGQTRRGACE